MKVPAISGSQQLTKHQTPAMNDCSHWRRWLLRNSARNCSQILNVGNQMTPWAASAPMTAP